jgi:hypothetical protein
MLNIISKLNIIKSIIFIISKIISASFLVCKKIYIHSYIFTLLNANTLVSSPNNAYIVIRVITKLTKLLSSIF